MTEPRSRPVEWSADSSPLRPALPLTGFAIAVYIAVFILLGNNPSAARIDTLVGVALAFVFIVEVTRRGADVFFPSPLIWGALFVCFSIFHMIWIPGDLARLFTMIQLLVFAGIFVNYVATHGLKLVQYSFYAATVTTFAYNIVASPEAVEGRVASTLGNPNTYALVLILGILLALRQLLVVSLDRKLAPRLVAFLLAYVSLGVYGIVFLTGSRKGILLSLAALAILALFWVWQQPLSRRMLVSTAVVVAFVVLGALLYNAPQFSRVVELSSFLEGGPVRDTGLTRRSAMLDDALRLWRERPLLGWGFDQFKVVSRWRAYSHNNYVELLANQGVVGLLLYLMIPLSAFVSLARTWRRRPTPALAADGFWGMVVIGVLLAWDAGAVSYYDKLTWMALALAVGMGLRGRLALRPGSRAVESEPCGPAVALPLVKPASS